MVFKYEYGYFGATSYDVICHNMTLSASFLTSTAPKGGRCWKDESPVMTCDNGLLNGKPLCQSWVEISVFSSDNVHTDVMGSIHRDVFTSILLHKDFIKKWAKDGCNQIVSRKNGQNVELFP